MAASFLPVLFRMPPSDPHAFHPRLMLQTLARGDGLLGMRAHGLFGPRGGMVTVAKAPGAGACRPRSASATTSRATRRPTSGAMPMPKRRRWN
jgi:hypothetical protein